MLKKIAYILLLPLALLTSYAANAVQPASCTSLENTVEYLMDQVTGSQLTFVRNGKPHKGPEAAEHMRKKYDHFRKDIQTPEDFVEQIFIASTHSYILFFTDKGKCYWLKVHEIPQGGRLARGKAIVNLLEMTREENITAFIPVSDFNTDAYLMMATKKGTVKKSLLSLYSRPRRGGIRAIILDPDDHLIEVRLTNGNNEIILATKKGMAVRFNEKDARPLGRTARGVKGVSLRTDDIVVSMVVAEDSKSLLTITANGFGKRTKIPEYRLINRGGKGVINIKCSQRNGDVVDAISVSEGDEIVCISQKGIMMRTSVKGISMIGRNTQGVRIMGLSEGDSVVSAAKIVNDE